MKKITFLIMLLFSAITFGQVGFTQNFNATTLPAGWTVSRYGNTATSICEGRSYRVNIYGTSATTMTGNIASPNFVAASNGTDLSVSFDYKVINFSGTNVATPAGWGNAQLQYSVNNGTSWTTAPMGTINDANHTVANTCATFSAVISGADLPTGSDVKLRVLNTWASGDYYFYVDNFTGSQVASNPPNCNSVLTQTTNVPLNGTLSWNAATGAPTGYFITLGSTSGGTDIANNVDNGNSTTYTLSMLMPGTTYFVTIRPYNAAGNATSCTEQTFTTLTPPINDECDDAIGLTVNSDFNCAVVTSSTTEFASASPQPDDATGTPNNDVWFTFVAQSTAHRISLLNTVYISGGTFASTDMGMSVFNDAAGCNMVAANEVGESDPDILNLTGLTMGNTYYVRVYGWSATVHNISFDICVGTPPPPPANDDCAGALPITESANNTCANSVSGTTVSATASTEADCSTTNRDVWYIMTAAQSANYTFNVVETEDFGFSSTYVSVHEGVCGALTDVTTNCTTGNNTANLVAGNVYYINVRSTSTTAGVNFDLCVFPTPAPPVNDDCAEAIMITESVDSSCANTVSGTTVSATTSNENDCSTTNRDVWYIMTAAQTNMYFFNVTETADFGASTTYVSVHEGTCGALTAVSTNCFTGSNTANLVAGNLYYINVRSTSTTAGVNFDLCVFPSPPAPANDDCGGAFALTPGITFDTNPLVGNNFSATGSTGITAPGCADYQGGDVWYSVVVPASGNLILETRNTDPAGSILDTGAAVYSGTCGSLTLVECDDDDGDDNFSQVTLSNPALGGQTVYFRVWEFGNNAFGNFRVSAYSSTLSTEDINAKGLDFSYFPNPVSNELTINAATKVSSVNIINVLGQTVYSSTPNTKKILVNMSELRAGYYFVQVVSGDTSKTIKVFKN